jgi:uncharacterized protein
MAANVALMPLRPSRPTIEIDGERSGLLEAGLLGYSLSDSIEGIANGELSFANWGGATPGFQYFDRRLIEFGKVIKIKQGDGVLFEGRIMAMNADYPQGSPPTINVMAEDRLQDLRMTRRTRCFSQSSLGDVARQIANDHGLRPQIDTNGQTTPLLAQLNQSDLAFLYDIARREDVDIYVNDGKLHVAANRNLADVSLAWAGSLRAFNVIADLAHQRTAVIASGWDVSAKQGVSHSADKSAISAEIGNDDAGADILEQKIGMRIDTLAHGLPSTAAEARALAESSYRHMARSFVTGEGVCETDPLIRVGARLELSGLGDLFNGIYRATHVIHLFDAEDGARTEFRCDRAGLGKPQ